MLRPATVGGGESFTRPATSGKRGTAFAGPEDVEDDMGRIVVRYKTSPGKADENARLIENVFEELHASKPDGVRYTALRLDDNTFVHIAEAGDDNPIPKLKAFQAFQSGIKDRCVEPPNPQGAEIVGNYRMLGD